MQSVLWFVVIFCVLTARSQKNETDLFTESVCLKGDHKCFEKIISTLVRTKDRVLCPGGKSQSCAEGYTCCESLSGDYNCCPHENAVCCSDHIHCCSQGSTCDTVSGRCVKDSVYLKPQDKVTCPGDEFNCPVKSTCCAISGGQYGCCPFQEAFCCPDQLHCCPQGFICGTGDVCVHATNSNISFSTVNLN